MTATLVVIAKAPVPGRVKTRLCPPLTPAQAAGLAEAALVDTLAAVADTPAVRRVVCLDGEPGDWLPAGFDVIAQHGDGLAARLANLFADVGGPALVVGMDTPQISSAHLTAALDALAGTDAVFGPAEDGGYWTIGLRQPDARVFADVPMSAGDTGARQRDRLTALGLRCTVLPALRDVDTIADAHAVATACPDGRFARAVEALRPLAA